MRNLLRLRYEKDGGKDIGNYLAHTCGNYEGGGGVTDVKMIEGG